MDVTVIIVHYNTVALLIECIRSVYQYTNNNTFEIIVVDNASADHDIKKVTDIFSEVQFIFNDKNVGFGSANNQGISIARGKYIFLLNSDTLLISDAVNAFFCYMEKPEHNVAACCGGDLIKPDGTKQVAYGNFPTLAEAISALGFFVFYRKFFDRNLSSGVFNYSDAIKKVDYICGADMFLRAEILKTTGIFDSDFFLYFEETELSFRISAAGYESILLPEVKIIHLEGASLGREPFNKQKLIFFAKSRRLFFNKCYGRLSGMVVNKIYALQALIFFLKKREAWYFQSALILFRL
jgi:GT2 family glycosyltransferase